MLKSPLITEFDQLFWTVFKVSKNLIAVTDANHRTLLAVNDAWLKTFKLDEKDVIGKTALELGIWPDEENVQKIAAQLNEKGSLENIEVQMQASDGSMRHCLLSAHTVHVSGRKMYVFSTEDVTETKRADEAVLSSRSMLIDALESINEGFVLYGADGGLIICNSKFKEFYGYSDEEAAFGAHRKYLGRLDIERKTVVVDDNKAEKYVNRRENNQSSPPNAFEVKLKDGRILLLSDRKTPSGGVVSIQSDITSQRKIEMALRRSQKMEAVGQLTGGIAHDFNNILSIVMGNIELFDDVIDGNEKAQSLALAAFKGAQRGAEITKKLLNFSSITPSEASRCSVNELLRDMEHIIGKALTATIQINLELAQDVWNVDINPGDFEDVILNLALNARDASNGDGTLTIETSNAVLDEDTASRLSIPKDMDYILVSLHDTGIGMSEETKEKIFDPFFTTKQPGKGTGLGLSMVYGFVQRSNGHITVQSEPDCGTVIDIYLPRSQIETKADALPENTNLNYQGCETILIVDDEPALVDIAASILAKLGYKVATAANGAMALDLLDGPLDIDLLFTDVIMPSGIDGYQLAQIALEKNPRLKVLMTSGYTRREGRNEDDDNEIVRKLSEHLLQKPYSRDILARRIRELLNSTDQ